MGQGKEGLGSESVGLKTPGDTHPLSSTISGAGDTAEKGQTSSLFSWAVLPSAHSLLSWRKVESGEGWSLRSSAIVT